MPILTLKNLYRVFTQIDYPLKSYRPVKMEKMRGMTLNRFWQEYFELTLPMETDLHFFDNSTGRNRNLSRLMNRSGSTGFMGEWFKKLDAGLDDKLFLRMTRLWIHRLEEWEVRPTLLKTRLQSMAGKIVEKGDLPVQVSAFLMEQAEMLNVHEKSTESIENRDTTQVIFGQSVLLAWMTIFSLYGTRPEDPSLDHLRRSMDMPLEELYKIEKKDRTLVETEGNSLFRIQPLSGNAYFGYREELHRVIRGMMEGRKICITGPGGIGKTELVRQALQQAVESGVFTKLFFLQYQHSLTESLAAAMPVLRNIQPEKRMEKFYRHIAMINDSEPGTVLLLIDNVEHVTKSDVDLEKIETLNSAVVMTSRAEAPSGMESVQLEGLSAEDGCGLFLRIAPETSVQEADVRAISETVAGHPLALTLFANLCHSRRWTAEKLREHLNRQGIKGLSYIGWASPVNLAEVIGQTLRLSGLTRRQFRMARFFSLLPYQYLSVEEILPLAGDVEEESETVHGKNEDPAAGERFEEKIGRSAKLKSVQLCERQDWGVQREEVKEKTIAEESGMHKLRKACKEMENMGWLTKREGKYAMHPLISEAIRLEPVHAGEFPKMWDAVGKLLTEKPEMPSVLISMAIKSATLTAEAVSAIVRLEQLVGSLSWFYIPDEVYDSHRMYIEDQNGTPDAVLDYWIGLGFRSLVRDGTRGENGCPIWGGLGRILPFLNANLSAQSRKALLTLLEYASATENPNEVEKIFKTLLNESKSAGERADAMISYSVKQRRADHDPKNALESLMMAEVLLDEAGEKNTIRRADLNYRRGVCFLDMGKPSEAEKTLLTSLEIMEENNIPQNSMKVMATRSTYAVALMCEGEYESALEEYEKLREVYWRQRRVRSEEYAMMLNNMGLTLDKLERTEEALALFEEVNRLDAELSTPPDVVATHQRNTAHILARLGRGEKAVCFAERAVQMRRKIYGANSGWTGDAEAVLAFARYQQGERQKCKRLITEAIKKLNADFGEKHRHTKNAREYYSHMDE